MINLKDDVFFSTNTKDMNLDTIFEFIKDSYWGELRSYEKQKEAIEGSINFGLFKNGKQIAYARVITDKVFFAYLLDVFVIKREQRKGYSKLLLDEILNFSDLANINKWMLATTDAHSLYEKYDFKSLKRPEKFMVKLTSK